MQYSCAQKMHTIYLRVGLVHDHIKYPSRPEWNMQASHHIDVETILFEMTSIINDSNNRATHYQGKTYPTCIMAKHA